MRAKVRTAEQKIALIAGCQHGNITRVQLLGEVGLSSAAVGRRLRKGTLLPKFRGVYRVGHSAPSLEAHYMAAVLACGEGAVLSGRAAACLYGLVKGDTPPPEVTTPTERRIPGIRTRQRRRLDRRDTTRFRRIPITTVPGTLVDLAGELGIDDLAFACHQAFARWLVRPEAVEASLARKPNAPGAGNLRRVLRGDTHVTLSRLEKSFLKLLRKHGLPLPQTNRPAGGRFVDCRWPQQRLTVELDSYRFHGSRHAWELDRRREREAYARGDEFRRYTFGDVLEHPAQMLGELRGLLPRRRTA